MKARVPCSGAIAISRIIGLFHAQGDGNAKSARRSWKLRRVNKLMADAVTE
jgi:hypothetical protein